MFYAENTFRGTLSDEGYSSRRGVQATDPLHPSLAAFALYLRTTVRPRRPGEGSSGGPKGYFFRPK